jgi:hypothetical protein
VYLASIGEKEMRALIPILIVFVGLGAKSVVDERPPDRWGTSDRVVVVRVGERLGDRVLIRNRHGHRHRDDRSCRDRRREEVEQLLSELIARLEAERSSQRDW